MNPIILTTEISGLPLLARGKVRDIYDLGDSLLLVATDRISAYDVIMPNGIPGKGRVLTQISRFWFLHLRTFVANHLITCDTGFIASRLAEQGVHVTPELQTMLEGRSMLCLKASMFPVECVVRGYISGSLWREYVDAGGAGGPLELHGVHLPGGLRESDRLPEPVFTPATKAESGHDVNIGMREVAELVGEERAEHLKKTSIAIYEQAAERARGRGILIADTKFEFGLHHGALMLCDEVLTPDSSRFWPASDYQPGRPQASFDKQYLRDWLTNSGWNRQPPAPELPPDVVEKTARKYREAYRQVTGNELS